MRARVPRYLLLALLMLALVFPLIVPNGYFVAIGISTAIYSLLTLGVVLLWGNTGLLTLGQAAFFGVGAYTSAILSMKLDWPPLAAALAAVVVTLAVALIVGAGVLRLEKFYFAVATLGFNYMAYTIFDGWEEMTRGSLGLVGVPSFSVGSVAFDNDTRFYYLILPLLVVIYAFCYRLTRTRTGRALNAIREDQSAASMLGISPFSYKLRVFLLVAGMAGLAGALQAHYLQICTPRMFDITISFEVVNMAIVGGYQSVAGALVGTAILKVVGESVSGLRNLQLLIYGFVFLVLLIYLPEGLVGWVAKWFARRARRSTEGKAAPASAEAPLQASLLWVASSSAQPILEVQRVSKSFGGLKVLRDVSFSMPPGSTKALIGPNGAGKTTLFNVLSGFLHPDAGTVRFLGETVNDLTPHQIARKGVERTFQITRVFKNLSLRDNVMVGAHMRGKTGLFEDGFSSPRARRLDRELHQWAMNCLDLVGLTSLAEAPAGSLPLGKQKLLEIARGLAARPKLLLLDEPAAGLNDAEVRSLMDIITQIKGHGLSILLVEHKMDMVMSLADEIVVLNFGRKISEGIPEQVRSDPKVISVYLGVD